MKRTTFLAALAAAVFSGHVFAQGAAGQPLPPIDDNAPVFGSQIMTPQERMDVRQRMRAARTLEEREQIRAEHHRQMVERAKERGITLPDQPPPGGGRMMGPGGGMMGPGGMGPRGGQGPGGAGAASPDGGTGGGAGGGR